MKGLKPEGLDASFEALCRRANCKDPGRHLLKQRDE
jgi:hypothetical protein